MKLFRTICIKLIVGVVSLVLALPVIAFVFKIVVDPNTAELTVENKSAFVIETANIKLCENDQQIKHLDPGKSASVVFDEFGECHYTVTVYFEDGSQLAIEIGYITSGSNFKDRVIVEDDKLVETKSEMELYPNYFAEAIGLLLGYGIASILLYKGFVLFLKKLRRREL